MPRFNPRLIAVILFAVVGYMAFQLSSARPNDEPLSWREFAAFDTKITAFALLGRSDNYSKPQEWYRAQPRFHDEIVLSQKAVTNSQAHQKLRQIFARIAPSEWASACDSDYRHALRFEKDGRTVDAKICFECGMMEVFDSAGKTTHVDFMLKNSQGRDQFDAIFARLGIKQFKP